jgi:hypothetical protein
MFEEGGDRVRDPESIVPTSTTRRSVSERSGNGAGSNISSCCPRRKKGRVQYMKDVCDVLCSQDRQEMKTCDTLDEALTYREKPFIHTSWHSVLCAR